MKVLLTGADGQLGRSLQACRPAHWRLHALAHAQLDITDQAAVEAVLQRLRPTHIINAAAYTAVDDAQRHPESAYAVNHHGAGLLAQAAKAAGAWLVHLSTDYVFDGRATGPYAEDDQTNPINVYGMSKRRGELAVLQTHLGACILRTSGVYSEHGRNFLRTMLRLAGTGNAEPLQVVDDQRCCPTYAGDLAQAIIAMADMQAPPGVYHYCGVTALSWYAFAQRIFQEAREQACLGRQASRSEIGAAGSPHIADIPSLRAIASNGYPGAALRPANSVLSCRKIQALGIARRPLQDSLPRALQAIILSGSR